MFWDSAPAFYDVVLVFAQNPDVQRLESVPQESSPNEPALRPEHAS